MTCTTRSAYCVAVTIRYQFPWVYANARYIRCTIGVTRKWMFYNVASEKEVVERVEKR